MRTSVPRALPAVRRKFTLPSVIRSRCALFAAAVTVTFVSPVPPSEGVRVNPDPSVTSAIQGAGASTVSTALPSSCPGSTTRSDDTSTVSSEPPPMSLDSVQAPVARSAASKKQCSMRFIIRYLYSLGFRLLNCHVRSRL